MVKLAAVSDVKRRQILEAEADDKDKSLRPRTSTRPEKVMSK